jgi:ATP-dependent DNA helicase RecG
MNEILDKLLSLSAESEVVEFKEAKTQYDKNKLGEYFSALSNEANLKGLACAWLVLGVKNDRMVVGTSISEAQINDYKLEMASFTSPRLSFDEVYRVETESKTVILCKIPAAPEGIPVSWKGFHYGRDGESIGALNLREQDLIRLQGKHQDWSVQIIKEATIEALDATAIAKAKEKFKEKKVGTHLYDEVDKWDTATFLDKAKITLDGKITNAAIILLGKPESVHFISPAVCQITWKLESGEEKAYQHFEPPLFLTVNDVLARIRNVRFKFFPNNQLIATEVLKYDPEVILEALNNCIAHQDYEMQSRIILTEKSGKLIFDSAGSFFEGSADDYTLGEKTPKKYRNKWLVEAMLNLNMIDSLGYGIHKMYKSQRQRFFPLPDYTYSTSNSVVLEIYGHSIDEKYAKLLIERKDDLSLTEVILLDKIQKNIAIIDDAAKLLKNKGLIEGRKPNYYVSIAVAKATGEKTEYIKQRGIDDGYCQKMIVQYLQKFGEGKREAFEKLLLDKLPDVLDIDQKRNKIKNNLQSLKNQGVITSIGKIWKMSKTE